MVLIIYLLMMMIHSLYFKQNQNIQKKNASKSAAL
jgi:hypothetical protein